MTRYFCDKCKAEVPPDERSGIPLPPEVFRVPVWRVSRHITANFDSGEVASTIDRERASEPRMLCVTCQDAIRAIVG